MKHEAKIKNIEADIEQLRRALKNPNLAASHQGSPANIEALDRIEKKHKEIEELSKEQ